MLSVLRKYNSAQRFFLENCSYAIIMEMNIGNPSEVSLLAN